jgi:threonine/homoserine/homoserine lactone efflux protein
MIARSADTIRAVDSLLAVVLPLALGAAVTPTIVGVQLVTLGGRVRPLAHAWALAAGCAAVLLVVSALALLVAGISNALEDPSPTGGVVKLVAAALLAALGVQAVRHRGAGGASAPAEADEEQHLRRSFALGAGLMATNFSSLVLYFPAMHEIGISDASDGARVLAFMLVFAIALIPAWGPPLLVRALGERARGPLDRLSGFFTAHRQAIAATLCFGFAALLAVVGVNELIST